MLLQGVISAIRSIKVNFSTREWPSPKKDKCQLEEKIVSDCEKKYFPEKIVFNDWKVFPSFIILDLWILFHNQFH